MNRPTFAVLCSCLVIVSLGAGCEKASPTQPNSNKPTSSENGNVQQPAKPPTPEELRKELLGVVDHFKNTKSFRAKITISSSNKPIDATIEFSKPDRFHGTVQTEGAASAAEIISVGSNFYMRVTGQPWMNLTKTVNAKTIGNTLNTTLNGSANVDMLGKDATIPVTKSYDGLQGCDVYKTQIKTPEGKSNDISVCVVNDLPKTLDLTTTEGKVHIEYYDINAVFLIEKPAQ